jgi:hypothetical protein
MKRRSLVLWLVGLLAVMSLVGVAVYARHRTGGTTVRGSASGTGGGSASETTVGGAASGTTGGGGASGTTVGGAASGTTVGGSASGSGGGGASGAGGGGALGTEGGNASGAGGGGALGTEGGNASGSGGGGASGSGGGGAGGGGAGGGGPSVTTELDLGQGFAEDPFFDGTLGPFALHVSSDRFDLSAIPLTFTLTNTTSSDVTEVQFVVTLMVLEGEVMPAPDQDVVRSVTASQGACEEPDVSPSTTRVSCRLETISATASANVRIIVSGAFRLSVAMGLEVGGG